MLHQTVIDILEHVSGSKKASPKKLLAALDAAATKELAPLLVQQLLLAASSLAEDGKTDAARALLPFLESIAARVLKPISAGAIDHSKARRATKATGFVEAKKPIEKGGGGGSRRLFDVLVSKG